MMINATMREYSRYQHSTRSYYENHAAEYFQATCSVDLTHEWYAFTSLLSKNDLILDLGCGSGRDLKYFANRGYRALGIDYSYPLAKLAYKYSGQEIIVGDIRHTSLKEKSVNGVWSMGSLLHLERQEVSSVLLKLHTVLKQDGKLFTAVKKGEGETFDSIGRWTVFYQVDEWSEMLLDSGYDILSIEEVTEHRKSNQDETVDITWIQCLAIASSHYLDFANQASFSVLCK